MPAGGQGGASAVEEERAEDWWEVEALYDLCFAPGRTALSSYRLREGVAPVAELCLARARRASLAARDPGLAGPGGRRAGAAAGAGRGAPDPAGRRAGRPADPRPRSSGRQPWTRVLLVGDAPYYGRFGFRRLDGVEMPPPTNPDRVLGLALVPGAWDGISGPVRPWDACLSDRAAP